MPAFSFFTIILLVPYLIPYLYPALLISPKIKSGKTGSVFNLSNQNWAVCLLELHALYELPFRLYGSSQPIAKKSVCVEIYCLVKHSLNFIVQWFSFFAEYNRFACRLDSHVNHNERYNLS